MRDAIQDYRTFIMDGLKSGDGFLLDAGCGGDSASIRNIFPKTKIVGIDLNKNALSENRILSMKVCGNLESLPFGDGMFSVVALHWVVEHCTDPMAVFSEIHRILRPGGKIVLMTPNILHPFYFISKWTPLSFHTWARKRLLGLSIPGQRTEYKANTPFSMRHSLEGAGFSDVKIVAHSNTKVYSFSKISLWLGLLYERTTDFGPLKNLKMFLVVYGRKRKK